MNLSFQNLSAASTIGFKGSRTVLSSSPAAKRSQGNLVDSQSGKRSLGNLTTASSEALERQTTPTKKAIAGSGNVFDRLTSSDGYTGTHKERFNADGTGKGISGRNSGQDQITLSSTANRSKADVRGVNVSFNSRP